MPNAFRTTRVEAVMNARNGAATVIKKSIGAATASCDALGTLQGDRLGNHFAQDDDEIRHQHER